MMKHAVVQAFISSRLDYCNSCLLFDIADNLLHRLQSVQNAAARLITRTGKYEHITPALHQLQWLPDRQRSNWQSLSLKHFMARFHSTSMTIVSS